MIDAQFTERDANFFHVTINYRKHSDSELHSYYGIYS